MERHVLLPDDAGEDEDEDAPLAGAAMAVGLLAGATIDVAAVAAVLTLRT